MIFSIIIPTYNRADFIENIIYHFLNQEYKDFELIIIDDGSTDNTKEIFNTITDSRVKYYYIENSERGAARNFGAKNAQGIYLNFFDSDDQPYKNHLSNAAEFIKDNNSPDIFHVGYRTINKDGSIASEETNFNYNIYERLIQTNFFACNSIFVKRNIFLQNQFNESRTLASAEDWELWLRLSSRYEIKSCNTVTFQMNNHDTRSLFTISPEKIYHRDTLLKNLLLKDEFFKLKYKKHIPMFIADRYTFFSLIYSLTKKDRVKTASFLIKAISSSIYVLKRKRFWASIKYLIKF